MSKRPASGQPGSAAAPQAKRTATAQEPAQEAFVIVYRRDYHKVEDLGDSSSEEYGTYDSQAKANGYAWGFFTESWHPSELGDKVLDLGTEQEGSGGFQAPNGGLKHDGEKGKYRSKTGDIRYTERDKEYMDWVVVFRKSDKPKRSADSSASTDAPAAKRPANSRSRAAVANPQHVFVVISPREYENVDEQGEVEVSSVFTSQAEANEAASELFKEDLQDSDEPEEEEVKDYGLENDG